MAKLDRYLLETFLTLWVRIGLLTLAILLLEKIVRITDLISSAQAQGGVAARMILSLIPQYLGIAIPGAVFLAVLIAIDKLSREGEITAATGTGISLWRLARPLLAASLVMSGFALFLTGWLQPMARYEYRLIVLDIKQRTVDTVFQEQKFVRVGDMVAWTSSLDREDGRLGETFLIERSPDAQDRLFISDSGTLVRERGQTVQIDFGPGFGVRLPEETQPMERMSFNDLSWRLAVPETSLRPRGKDDEELTLPELLRVAAGAGDGAVEPGAAAAAIHNQLARSVLTFILPLLAIPLGLGYGRTPSGYSVLVGVILLVTIHKSLEYAYETAVPGLLPPASPWAVLGGGAILTYGLFWRSASTLARPPLTYLSFSLPGLQRLRRLLPGQRDTAGAEAGR